MERETMFIQDAGIISNDLTCSILAPALSFILHDMNIAILAHFVFICMTCLSSQCMCIFPQSVSCAQHRIDYCISLSSRLIYLFEKQTYRKRGRDAETGISPTHSLPKWREQPSLGQDEARCLQLHRGLVWVGYLLLPPKYIFRELNLEMEQLRLEPGLMCYAGITRGSLTYCHDSLLYLLF